MHWMWNRDHSRLKWVQWIRNDRTQSGLSIEKPKLSQEYLEPCLRSHHKLIHQRNRLVYSLCTRKSCRATVGKNGRVHPILLHFRKTNAHKFKQMDKNDRNTYSRSLELANDWSSDMMSNLSFVAFVSEQIVTVGNGIDEMSRSVRMNETGLRDHFDQMLWIDEPHNQIDDENAINHHNLDPSYRVGETYLEPFRILEIALKTLCKKLKIGKLLGHRTFQSNVACLRWGIVHRVWNFGCSIR